MVVREQARAILCSLFLRQRNSKMPERVRLEGTSPETEQNQHSIVKKSRHSDLSLFVVLLIDFGICGIGWVSPSSARDYCDLGEEM